MRIQRKKHVYTDGREKEFVLVSDRDLDSPDEVEQLGRDLLQAATEWQAEIETRGPPGPPAYKMFDFVGRYGGQNRVASWIEHPWALVRFGGGTSIAFLVKEVGRDGGFQAWIVSAKIENGAHQWKCRFDYSSTVAASDVIHVIRYTLPDSPTLGDIEFAREKARRGAA